MGSLAGKVALVTGAAQGLGLACARLFVREGAKVVLADVNRERGEEAAQALRNDGAEAIFVRADISDPAEVRAMVRSATETHGRLDCAVNNAVLAIPYLPLAEISFEDWTRAMAVNVTGTFLCMKYEIEAMRQQGGGSIVNIGSGRETTAKPALSWYLAGKQAVYGMTKCAALDHAGDGIRINAIAPGVMWTPTMREVAEQMPGLIDDHLSHVPLGRIAEPEEVAEGVVWLCTDSPRYVHGATLAVDGGYVLT
jgi:NAD(P)-dependent dehydrogenase (short-subunit alcohol dehydrogenase family)